MSHKKKFRLLSDIAFDAVDADSSNTLDVGEMAKIMKEVAEEMRIKPPTEPDINVALQEMEITNSEVTKDTFDELIVLILSKMLESEIDFED